MDVSVVERERRARLEALFAAHSRDVLAYAARRTDQASAGDVLSEVFVVAWRRLDEIPCEPLPWLLAVARRVLANQRRGARRRELLLDRVAACGASETAPPLAISDSALRHALAALGERDRQALLLTAWEGLSAKEAALVLGCSTQAFIVRSHRARRRLAAQLRPPKETSLRTPRMGAYGD
jgi:RNA polymerase sigma-70 factor, ECF subfamily